MAAAEPKMQRPSELQTCSGFGLVSFERAAFYNSTSVSSGPMVRCLGRRATQQPAPTVLTKVMSNFHDESGAVGSKPKDVAHDLVEVAKETRAVGCAGHMALFVPEAYNAPAACSVRCNGLSFRLDNVKAQVDSAANRVAAHEGPRRHSAPASSQQPQDVAAEQTGGLLPPLEDLRPDVLGALDKSRKGLTLVVGRMGEILVSMRNTACDASATQRVALDTADAAKRICLQAGKITKRSAEQVHAVATWPWRLGGGEGGAGTE